MHCNLTYFENSKWDQGKRKLNKDDRPHSTPVLCPTGPPLPSLHSLTLGFDEVFSSLLKRVLFGTNSSNHLYKLHNSYNILLSEAEKPLSC